MWEMEIEDHGLRPTLGKKIVRLPQETSLAWWFRYVIPGTLEAEVRGS
jgi:hypothetical protein